MREEFATVDEVNTVLGNYVLKTDMLPTVDLSEYYNKSEIDEKLTKSPQNVNIINGLLQDISIPHYVEGDSLTYEKY